MKQIVLLVLWLLLYTGASSAQVGTFNETLGGAGLLVPSVPGNSDFCEGMAMDDQENIYFVGNTFENSYYHSFVFKFFANGTIDYDFGDDGFVLIEGDSAYENKAFSIAIDNAGGIYIGGSCFTDKHYSVIYKLSPNGTMDTAFADNGRCFVDESETYNCTINDIEVLGNKTLVWCGINLNDQNDPSSITCFTAGRVSADGKPEQYFGEDGKFKTVFGDKPSEAKKIKILPNGKIIIGGNADEDFGFVQLLSNGDPDNSFGMNGKAVVDGEDDAYFQDMVIGQNGIIYSCGYQDVSVGGTCHNYQTVCFAAAITQNGEIYAAFAQNGQRIIKLSNCNSEAYCILQQPDGKLLLGCANGPYLGTTPHDNVITRLEINGETDLTFGEYGKSTANFDNDVFIPKDMLLKSDGSILLAGVAESSTGNNYYCYAIQCYTDIPASSISESSALISNYMQINIIDNSVVTGFGNEYPFNTCIYDMQGRIVFSGVLNDANTAIDLTGLPESVYILQLQGQYSSYTKKFLISPEF